MAGVDHCFKTPGPCSHGLAEGSWEYHVYTLCSHSFAGFSLFHLSQLLLLWIILVGWVGESSLDLDHCSSDLSDIAFALESFREHEWYSHKPEKGHDFILIYMFICIYVHVCIGVHEHLVFTCIYIYINLYVKTVYRFIYIDSTLRKHTSICMKIQIYS